MAKYQTNLKGDFDTLLDAIEKGILEKSSSATCEDQSYYCIDGVRCAIKVFERYSFTGKNRVSMSLMLLGKDNDLHVTVITSGGSQAVFLKLNTIGENSFLELAVDIIEQFKNQ